MKINPFRKLGDNYEAVVEYTFEVPIADISGIDLSKVRAELTERFAQDVEKIVKAIEDLQETENG